MKSDGVVETFIHLRRDNGDEASLLVEIGYNTDDTFFEFEPLNAVDVYGQELDLSELSERERDALDRGIVEAVLADISMSENI